MQDFITLVHEVWNRGLFGISLGALISSLLIIFFAFLFRGWLISVVVNFLKKLAKKTESKIDDEILKALEKPLGLVPVTLALYLSTIILGFDGRIGDIATNIVKSFVIYTIFSVLSNSIKPMFSLLSTNTWLTPSMQIWLERASRFIVWVIGAAIIFDIFGIKIGPLVAGLGLFSVAVALGAQDFFKNLIAGILIIGENRFQPGDRIEVPGKVHGIVENIGFRSTVLRNFDTAPMIIPNKDLSDVQLLNHGEMRNRRINWKINLLYSTSKSQLKLIRDDITNYLNQSKDFVITKETQPVVRVVELGSSSIDLMIVAFAEAVNFVEYNKIKENLIFEIMDIVKKHESDFAYPSTSLYVETMPK